MTLKYTGYGDFQDVDRRVRISISKDSGATYVLQGDRSTQTWFIHYEIVALPPARKQIHVSIKYYVNYIYDDVHQANLYPRILIPEDQATSAFTKAFEGIEGRPPASGEVAQFLADIAECFLLRHHHDTQHVPQTFREPEIILFEGMLSEHQIYQTLNVVSGPAAG